MRLPSWIWKTNTTGTVAITNMAILGVCGITHILMFSDHIVHVDTEPQWKLAVASTTGWIAVVCTFPFGWLVELFNGNINAPPIYAPFYVPVNAYLWGAAASYLERRYQEKKGVKNFPNCEFKQPAGP